MSDATNLVIWGAPNADHSLLIENLRSAIAENKTPIDVVVYSDFDAVVADKTSRLCLVFTAPESVVSRAIHSGDDPFVELDDWAIWARQTLELHHQNKHRTLLFEASHLRRNFNVGLAKLGVSSATAREIPQQDPTADDHPLLDLIASAYLQERPEIVGLREEMVASSQLLSSDAIFVPLPQAGFAQLALQSYRNQAKAALMKDEIHSGKIAEKNARLEQYQTWLDDLEKKSAAKLKENDGRISNLEKLNRQNSNLLSSRAAEINELRSSLEESQKSAGGLTAELHQFMSSRSMRITKPLRLFMGLFHR